MPANPAQRTRRWKRFTVGVIVTLIFASLFVFAQRVHSVVEPRFQDVALWQMRPPVEASPDVTIIEIDDGAIDRIGRWPWPWPVQADLIKAIAYLEPRVILVDITYSDRPDPVASTVGQQITVIDPVPPLVDAFRGSPVALTYTLYSTAQTSGDIYAKVEAALAQKPALTPSQVAEQTAVDPSEVDKLYYTALRRAIEIRLATGPEVASYGDALKLLAQIFPELAKKFPALPPPVPESTMPADSLSCLEQLRLAHDEISSGAGLSGLEYYQSLYFQKALDFDYRLRQLTRRGAVQFRDSPDGPHPPVAVRVDPPLAGLTTTATGLGFPSVVPDDDGIVRRFPLAIRYGDHVYPHLALEAAMIALGHPDYELAAVDGDKLAVTWPGGGLDIPVGAKCDLVINWSAPREGRPDGFRHLPMSRVDQLVGLLDTLRQYEGVMVFAAKLDPKTNASRADLVRRLEEAFCAARNPLDPPSELRALEDELARLDEQLAMGLSTLEAHPEDGPPDLDRARLAAAMDFIRNRFGEDSRPTRRNLEYLRRELVPYINNRVCLIGMTATAASLDLKPTPLDRAYPGVGAHAAVIDNILRQDFVADARPPLRMGMLIVVGFAVTLFAGSLPTLRATLAAVGALAIYCIIASAVLWHTGLLMSVAGPAVTGAAALLGVMTYRELTEGRSRRWITGVLKQYTSDEVVDAVVANPDFLALGGQRREMTVYFSDIAGFTSISERLDAPTLVRFLQMYLEQMTDRLLEQGGTLDKYEGDAIIAFFNGLVAMPDHAARCLRSALAHLRALPRIDQSLQEAGLLPEGTHLRARIGISSGFMNVGNFGSSRRFDYTVIGDSVNVGARLEGANRFFGTTVLMSARTRELAIEFPSSAPATTGGDGEFLFRRIGPVRFVGKAEAIDVYELLDPDIPGARNGLDLYNEALDDFEQAWYEEAREKFARVLELRPGDGPTKAFLQRIDSMLRDDIAAAPGPWDMTSKE